MTAQGNGPQLDADHPQIPDTQTTAASPSDTPREAHRPSSPTMPGTTSAVKTELDDDVDLDTKNMANAPFVNKVWRIVNDKDNHKFIRWVPGGKSIQIVDREGFEKQLLPYYFKHKRFTSFVRQLNMYGWHKVQDLSTGTMQSSEEHWQFANPNFVEGHPELLRRIVRNKSHKPGQSNGDNARIGESRAGGAAGSANGGSTDEAGDRHDLKAILKELEQIKSRQIHIGEDLSRMRKDNELLWTEYYQTRERYDKHSQMLSRILRFLATVYGNQSKILDLSDPNSPASQAAERVLRGPVDGHQQPYLGLLPSSDGERISPADSYHSRIHDLREIEQMQHQIEEANSSSSHSPSFSGAESVGTRESGTSTPQVPSGNTPRGPANESRDNNGSLELVPSRRTSQVIVAPPPPSSQQHIQHQQYPHQTSSHPAYPPNRRISNFTGPRDDRVKVYANTGNSGPAGVNNQLIRAPPNSRYTPSNIPAPSHAHGDVNANMLPNSPQLQEIPNNYDDPDKLFPELEDLSQVPNVPPLTSQELEQISRDVASNGTSLQNIQDWLTKQNLDNYDDDHFNVDDFISTEDGNASHPQGSSNDPSGAPSNNQGSSSEPDRKRVRVS